MKKFIKDNASVVFSFLLGIVLSGYIVYAATIAGTNVTYSSTTVQAAIDDLYTKCSNCSSRFLDGATKGKTPYYASQNATTSKDAVFNCLNTANRTFDFDGIYIFTGIAAHGGATDSSNYAYIGISYDTNTELIKSGSSSYRSTAFYKNGYEDLSMRVWAFKVKNGQYLNNFSCTMQEKNGRYYNSAIEVKYSG